MHMKRDTFSFSYKGNLILLFFLNSIRGQVSPFLVLKAWLN